MPKLHSQLAIFGAIDKEVTDAKNRLRAGEDDRDEAEDYAVIDLAKRFLPGTAGFGQHGWYRELTTYLNRTQIRKSEESLRFPTLGEALGELREVGSNEGDFRDPVLARASYGAVVLAKIYGITGRSSEDEVLAILPPCIESWAGPDGPDAAPDRVEEFMKRIDFINNREMWFAVAGEVLGQGFAQGSRPCFGALKKVDGQYCAFITTDSEDPDLLVKDIAKIVEPLNWAECCKFFCKMTPQANYLFNGLGWSRVIERISGECNEYYLDTALVFWKEQQADGSIFINYDLDAKRDPNLDSLLVEVDSGYIWVTPLPGKPKGVRIRTSKLERVSGLSPSATAALACLLGWGDTGHEMLAGTARKYMKVPPPPPPPTIQPFKRSPNNSADYKV